MHNSKSNVKPVCLNRPGRICGSSIGKCKQSVKTYTYLDNGSCQSLLLKSSAKALGLNLEKTGKMPISGYHTPKEINCSEVCFDIKPIDSSLESVRLNDVIAVPVLSMSAVNVAQLNALCKIYDHLNHKKFP